MYWGFEFFDWTVRTRVGIAHNGFFLQWNALVLKFNSVGQILEEKSTMKIKSEKGVLSV